MKRAWLLFAGELAVPRVRELRRQKTLVEIETDWFPHQLRSQLDKHGAGRARILTYGRFEIDTPKVKTPHADLIADEKLRRALSALDPELGKWLSRFQPLRNTTSRSF